MKAGKSIRVDIEVYDTLKRLAEPLTDTPNSVLRRVLKLDNKEVRDRWFRELDDIRKR